MKLLILLSTLILSFEVLAQDEVNAVIQGRKSFETFACLVCHAAGENYKPLRLGSNLYGLFQHTPRSREVLSSASGIKPLLPFRPGSNATLTLSRQNKFLVAPPFFYLG